eukprot:g7796.t1
MPMSETMVELQRQVAVHSSAMDQLQEKLDNELHRTELKLGTARMDAQTALLQNRFIVGVSMFSNWSTRSAARNQSLERSKQLPALRPPPSMHFADVHLLDSC